MKLMLLNFLNANILGKSMNGVKKFKRVVRSILEVVGRGWSQLCSLYDILICGKKAWTLLYEDDMKCISFYASKTQNWAVEIGTFNGGSACLISQSLPPKAKLVTIDPYIKDSMNLKLQGSFLIAFCNLLRHGGLSKVKLIKGYSNRIAKNWNKSIDFLFIDGSHIYEHVKRDFEDWEGFISKDGYLLFHDSNKKDLSDENKFENGWNGPTMLCNEIKKELIHRYRHIESMGSVNVFQKL